MAVEEANREGGCKGIPFRLVHAWSANPWGNGAGEIARIAYRDHVWAFLGSIDGATTHILEQIAAKALLTVLSPVSTDGSVNKANVPWIFSCMPPDARYAALLGSAALEAAGGSPLLLISGTDHDSRAAVAEILSFLSHRGTRPLRHLEIRPGGGDVADLGSRIGSPAPAAAVVVADALDSARIVVRLREAGFGGAILGGPSLGRRAFVESAGSAAEGALFPFLCDPAFASTPFARDFSSRQGRGPDCATAQTHDAMRLLVAAVREAGLNRPRIRDAVQALSPWSGGAGAVEWDNLGQNLRPARLGTIRGGESVPLAPARSIP